MIKENFKNFRFLLFASQTQVDCTKWESWDKYNKIWQPINKGTIDDFAAEKFCKKNF